MKQLIVQRAWADDRATIGMLTIKGFKHEPIFTLENPLRATTVDSRIPAGLYKCAPYSSAKFSKAWEIKNVPGRTAILIHAGNTEVDTTGCILVGLSASTALVNKTPQIAQSRDAMLSLQRVLNDEEFTLEVRDA